MGHRRTDSASFFCEIPAADDAVIRAQAAASAHMIPGDAAVDDGHRLARADEAVIVADLRQARNRVGIGEHLWSSPESTSRPRSAAESIQKSG